MYVQSYGFVADVSGMGMLEFGPVLQHPVSISSHESSTAQHAPTLQPGFGVSDLDSSVTFLQGTVLHPLQRAGGTELVLPS